MFLESTAMSETKIGSSSVSTVTLTAKQCIWFSWVPSGSFTGPEGESGVAYRPFQLDVSEISSIKVRQLSGSWGHSPDAARQSGADGLNGSGFPPLPNDSRSLENNAYKSSTYNSANIQPINTNLNKLVGMLGIDSGTTASQFIVGSWSNIVVPIGTKWLFLAFHDGHQWTNNQGEISVELTVQTDAARRGGSGDETSTDFAPHNSKE